MADPYDTWEKTEAALKALRRLVFILCEAKPSNTAPKATIDAWNAEMTEVRAWAVKLHERRIDLNLRELAAWKNTRQAKKVSVTGSSRAALPGAVKPSAPMLQAA